MVYPKPPALLLALAKPKRSGAPAADRSGSNGAPVDSGAMLALVTLVMLYVVHDDVLVQYATRQTWLPCSMMKLSACSRSMKRLEPLIYAHFTV